MSDAGELLTLIALAGSQRLPHLEVEIFAQDIVARVYVEQLNRGYIWAECGFAVADDNWYGYVIRCYACIILETRWIEAEPFLRKCPEQWKIYLRNFDIRHQFATCIRPHDAL